MAKIVKIEVTPQIRRKLAARFKKTESTIYNWLGEKEEETVAGEEKKCRELAISLGGKAWALEN